MAIGAEPRNEAAEAAKVAQDAVQRYLGDSAMVGRTYFNVMSAIADASLRSAFELQIAGVQATRTLMDSAMRGNQSLLDQATDSLRKSQDATAKLAAAGFNLVESALPKKHG